MTAFKNELLNQLTLALENYFGVSENSDYAVLFGTGGTKVTVSWVFKLSLEKVICGCYILAELHKHCASKRNGLGTEMGI